MYFSGNDTLDTNHYASVTPQTLESSHYASTLTPANNDHYSSLGDAEQHQADIYVAPDATDHYSSLDAAGQTVPAHYGDI